MKEYTLSEAIEILNISENTLRNYIKVFNSFFSFKRGDYNRIIFTEGDIETLQKILHHNKEEKISTKYIKKILRSEQDLTATERLKLYFESKVDEIKKGIEDIARKVEFQEKLLLNLMTFNKKVEEKISFFAIEERNPEVHLVS